MFIENNYYPFGLKHKGYNNAPLTNHPYKYNGKELNEELELDWYDYGARNYDAALGRWMNLDPLADNYRSFTPYSYVASNPILMTDPDGKRISFSFEYEKDEDGNEVVNKDGNRNLIGVTMTVIGKVMNVSGKKVDMEDAISEISGAIKSSFNGESSEGVQFNTVVNLTEAKSMDDINESDHVFALANVNTLAAERRWGKDKYDRNNVEVNSGVNQAGGKVALIDVDYFRGVYNTSIGNEGERSANHEFGHLSGLGGGTAHTKRWFNLMVQGDWGSGISKAQLSTIIKNSKYDEIRINRGTNYIISPLTGKKSLNYGSMKSLFYPPKN